MTIDIVQESSAIAGCVHAAILRSISELIFAPVPVIGNTDNGTELARLAEAGEPVSGAVQQLRRIRAGAEPGNEAQGRRLVRAERRPASDRLRWHLDDVQR